MVANEKISPWGTEAKFLKIESRNLSQSKKKKKKKKKKKMASTYFFPGRTSH